MMTKKQLLNIVSSYFLTFYISKGLQDPMPAILALNLSAAYKLRKYAKRPPWNQETATADAAQLAASFSALVFYSRDSWSDQVASLCLSYVAIGDLFQRWSRAPREPP